jgi:N-acetylglucosamine-6-phosphate deacetylase
VPRHKSAVKANSKKKSPHLARFAKRLGKTPGSVDLHFHGAFGIDLMTASPEAMSDLAHQLWQNGISAFCPTTLSASPDELKQAIGRIGPWIRAIHQELKNLHRMAIPLGIHLEGPFIHPDARGAHPRDAIRPVTVAELDELWELSEHTLKILTLAPETLPDTAREIADWCRQRQVILSLGHSRATEEQATQAFNLGFSGVTHAWNALSFHHRAPGPLGAALGRKGIHVELIIDHVHVSPTVLRWTRQLHGKEPLCYVSDCVPAAATADSDHTPGPWTCFGALQVRQEKGACYLRDGGLAGGGRLLPQMIGITIKSESQRTGQSIAKILKEHTRHWTVDPLRALKTASSLQKRILKDQMEWISDGDGLVARRPPMSSMTSP